MGEPFSTVHYDKLIEIRSILETMGTQSLRYHLFNVYFWLTGVNMDNDGQSIISKQFDAGIKDILNSFESFSDIEHNPTKGDCREDSIRNFIEKILPPWVGVGRGIIVDRNGEQSPQMDIVIYNKNMLPVLFREGMTAWFFPVDCVIYVIEVKSVLTAAEIIDSVGKFSKLRKLNGVIDNTINTVLLGYKSDLKLKNELVRYSENDQCYGISPSVTIIASIQKGEYFYFRERPPDTGYPNLRIKYWAGLAHETETDIFKFLFTGIMNTLFQVHIGEYILRDGRMPVYTIHYHNEIGVELYKEEDIVNGNIKAHSFKFDAYGKFLVWNKIME
jgi:hypothetical protein